MSVDRWKVVGGSLAGEVVFSFVGKVGYCAPGAGGFWHPRARPASRLRYLSCIQVKAP